MWSCADSCSCLHNPPLPSAPPSRRPSPAGVAIIAMTIGTSYVHFLFLWNPPPSVGRKWKDCSSVNTGNCSSQSSNRKGESRGRVMWYACLFLPQVWQLRGVPARAAEEGGVPPGLREAGVWKGRTEREAEAKSNSESTDTKSSTLRPLIYISSIIFDYWSVLNSWKVSENAASAHPIWRSVALGYTDKTIHWKTLRNKTIIWLINH